jgi:hypothetical protein
MFAPHSCTAVARHIAFAFLIAWMYPSAAHAAPSDPIVTVQLRDGRRFTAAVDARTNDDRLWLRFDRSATMILRPVEWTAIESVEHGDKNMSVAEFKPIAADVASERHLQRPRSPSNSATVSNSHELTTASAASLDITASLANWDADPEPDGLEVRLQTRDAAGRVTPAEGTVEATLVGVTGVRRASPSGRARAIDDRFPVLGRWTVTIRPEDFDNTGATIRLPFQAVDPNLAEEFRSLGAVHVRLAVPGVGVLAATDDAVLLRSTSPLRSRHESIYRNRMLPPER